MASSSHNRNPEGHNQYGPKPRSDDPQFAEIMRGYHREGLSSNKTIRARLISDHGIDLSEGTIKTRRNELGLFGSRSKKHVLTEREKEQLVISAMERDPAQGQGKATIQAKVAFLHGVHLPRVTVSEIMHIHAPEGFVQRSPNEKRIFRVKKMPLGIHERWAGDGHDKLYSIGFPIWAIVDDATGKWLGAWVVPSNRLGSIVGYLFLCLVEEYGGIPLQMSLDCGTETTQIFGMANALREIFHPELNTPENDLPAVRYMRSVHNISIERAWLRLRWDFGTAAVDVFNRGIEEGHYNPNDEDQVKVVRWLWPIMLQKELDDFRAFRNGARMRKDNEKAGPSGCSRNDAFSCFTEWGGQNLLQPVDVGVVQEMKEALGGDSLLSFVDDDFAACCKAAYETLGVVDLNLDNIWRPGMSPSELRAVNDKPQCAGCGLAGNIRSLNDKPLCNGCIVFYQKEPFIPREILAVPGALALLSDSFSGEKQPAASARDSSEPPTGAEAMELAHEYQRKASDTRIGNKVRTTETAAGSARFPSLNKAKQVVADRKKLNLLAKSTDITIGIRASLWYESAPKVVQIPTTRVAGTYLPTDSFNKALDDLLKKCAALMQSKYEGSKTAPPPCTWDVLTVHYHESNSKFTSLSHAKKRKELTVKDVFDECCTNRLIRPLQVVDRTMELRFIFGEQALADLEEASSTYFHTPSASRSAKSSAASASAKRKRASVATVSEGPAAPGSAARPSSSAAPGTSRPPSRLPSAFRPPPRQAVTATGSNDWTIDIPLLRYKFIRQTAAYSPEVGLLSWKVHSASDDILIVSDLSRTTFNEGFLGEGYSKFALYARFGTEEYGITLIKDDSTPENEARSILKAEFGLLCQGHWFKKEFDSYASTKGVQFPDFDFNFPGSFYGELVQLPGGHTLPFPCRCFIATPLLVGKVKKYTGNAEMGVPEDNLTKAIHAFTHFTYMFSHKHLIYCDLQGACDKSGKVALIDPQVHTNTAKEHRNAYWDMGEDFISKLVDEHEVHCPANWVCSQLDFQNLVIDEVSSPASSRREPRSPQKKAKVASPADKMDLGFITVT